jgi:hypothetical protein
VLQVEAVVGNPVKVVERGLMGALPAESAAARPNCVVRIRVLLENAQLIRLCHCSALIHLPKLQDAEGLLPREGFPHSRIECHQNQSIALMCLQSCQGRTTQFLLPRSSRYHPEISNFESKASSRNSITQTFHGGRLQSCQAPFHALLANLVIWELKR